jgi:RNA polymerase sigma factor (sigma-70 family)
VAGGHVAGCCNIPPSPKCAGVMLTTGEPSDRDLMLAVRSGQLGALDAIFVRHSARIHAFLARLTGDRDAADDLVQDVFLRVLRYRARYDGSGDFVAWLFRIARNTAATCHARRREVPALAVDAAPTDDLSTLDQMISDEHHAQLGRALAALPFAHREVLLLRGTEGLPHRAVAEALGCSEGAARVRLSRALVALREQWNTLAGEVK